MKVQASLQSADSPEHLLLAFTKTSIPAGCVSVGVYYFPFFDTDDTIVWPEQTHYHSSKDKNSWVCVIHWIRTISYKRDFFYQIQTKTS